jgi:hypothetical protein
MGSNSKEKKEKKRKRDDDVNEDPLAREKRRAAKKAEKVAKVLGYTNDVNPFGDSNLLQPFVWGKKKEKDFRDGKKDDTDSNENRLKLMNDIDKVRKRREEREKELEEMERLRSEETRLREAATYSGLQEKEEEFHLEQTRQRSKIRLVESRGQPIDFLAQNLLMLEAADNKIKDSMSAHGTKDDTMNNLISLDFELRDPVTLVDNLNLDELRALIIDIDSYVQLEIKREGIYVDFWNSLKTIAVEERRKKELFDSRTEALHKSVKSDVDKLFKDKNINDLARLKEDIDRSITDESCNDRSYWERMSKEVIHKIARIHVNNVHKGLLKKQLDVLSSLQEEARKIKQQARENADKALGGVEYKEVDEFDESQIAEELRDMEENMARGDEVSLPGSTYWWQDKYRPRKPKYFNRVRTGWDWNKYNQTHFDKENPPPKTIQGYKFSIFYPDLMDKNLTPKYYIEPSDEKEFVILRFHAGAPYEDIAFKIMNRDWEINRHSGFKCMMDRGVLQLHFNFKRHFYRR